jgi:hypothetical protein
MPEPDERLRHRREAGEQSGRGAPVASRGAIGIVNARAAEGMTRNDTRPPWCQADIKRRLAKLGKARRCGARSRPVTPVGGRGQEARKLPNAWWGKRAQAGLVAIATALLASGPSFGKPDLRRPAEGTRPWATSFRNRGRHISERCARSSRNRGRHHPETTGGFTRNRHLIANSKISQHDKCEVVTETWNGAPLPPRLKERQMCLIIFAATLAAAICLNVTSLMMQNNNFSVFRIMG